MHERAPEGASTCRSTGAEGAWIEKVYDSVIASGSLKGNFLRMEVVEDFESKPHKAVSFVVEREKEMQEWNEQKMPNVLPVYSGGRLPGRRTKEKGSAEVEVDEDSEEKLGTKSLKKWLGASRRQVRMMMPGAQQPVVGPSAALRWCDRLPRRHGLVPVDVTPSNMIATCGGIGTATVVQVLDLPAGIVGVNGVMRFLVLEEPTSITIMRQLGANIRMKDSGDVLEIEDDRGTIHTEKLVTERSGNVHNQLDFFFREVVGNCQTA